MTEMKYSVALKYEELVFLSAYFRLCDLSIDRAYWGKWTELAGYLKEKAEPLEVVAYFEPKLKNIEPVVSEVPKIRLGSRNIHNRIKSFVGIYTLDKSEVLSAFQLLAEFKETLEIRNDKFYPRYAQLRISMAKYFQNQLSPLLKRKERNRVLQVEHFRENPSIDTIKFSSFVPSHFRE